MDWFRRLVLIAVVAAFAAGPARADQNDPNLDQLFDRLYQTKNTAEAQAIEGQIWQIWVLSGQELVNSAMARGVIAMNRGAFDASLKYFNDVVRLSPQHAEGWNKRATVHFMMGNYPESVVDIQRTLKLEPRHFGALSGLGIIYSEMGKKKAAIRAWEKALAINPLMDTIKGQLEELKTAVDGKPI
ncbi:MAG: tetratricopeptide repeat protein [Rhodospirillaceae bacterium]